MEVGTIKLETFELTTTERLSSSRILKLRRTSSGIQLRLGSCWVCSGVFFRSDVKGYNLYKEIVAIVKAITKLYDSVRYS